MVSHALSLKRMNLARPPVCTPPPPPPPSQSQCWLRLLTPQPIYTGQLFRIAAHATFSQVPANHPLRWRILPDFYFCDAPEYFPNGATLEFEIEADFDPAMCGILATWFHPTTSTELSAALFFELYPQN